MAFNLLSSFRLLPMVLALFPLCCGAAVEDETEVRTPGRAIILSEGRQKVEKVSSGLLVFKFKGEPGDGLIDELGRRGIEIVDMIERDTYWARSRGEAVIGDIDAIEAVIKPTAEDKITPMLSEMLSGIADDGKKVAITVSFFEGIRTAEALALIHGLDAKAESREMLFGNRMIVDIEAGRLNDLAASEMVMTLECGPGKKEIHNYATSKTIGADAARREYKIDGDGVAVGIWDGGSVSPHKAFGNRLTIVDKVAEADHATHVAGTIAAGGANRQARGMAYGASLYSYDYEGDVPSEMASASKSHDVVLTNNSWGYVTGWALIEYEGLGYIWTWFGKSGFGRYSSEAAAYDKLSYQKELTIVFSAGNDRGDDFIDWVYVDALTGYLYWGLIIGSDGPYMTVGSNASAKNVLTVGAVKGAQSMTDFSSWGPTRDGRVKPEVVAPGVNLYSTLPNGKYGRMSGTSMSAPVVTGSLALLTELWRRQFGEGPSNAVLRNIVATTATDRGARGPDYKFGFGVLNVAKAAALIEANKEYSVIIENALTKSDRTHTYTLELSGSPASRNVCLAWTDPPARPDAYRTLVNDLDIRVIDPNGRVYYPWALDGSRPSKGAQTGLNHADNIELVWLKKAKAGTWTIEVTANYFGKGSRQKYVLSVCLADK